MVSTPTNLPKRRNKSDSCCDFALSSQKIVICETRSRSIKMPSKRRGRSSKNKQGIMVKVNKYGIPIKDKEAKTLIFKAKSYLRDRAIGETSFRIRSMKKKAYQLDKTEIKKMIIEDEKKIIKKEGWSLIRKAAFIHFGIMPFT